MATKIEIAGVSHAYEHNGQRVLALDDVSLAIQAGELVSIVGPSGCGKTTLLFGLAGFITPSRGSILVDGVAVKAPGPERGVVFQSFALFKWLTVEQNVEFGPKMRAVPAAERRERVQRLLALVGLSRFKDRYPYELSGGMQQRAAIARALANAPAILLMDEPFGSLDAQSRDMMQEELLRIWSASGATIVFVTHSVDEAIYLSSRVVVFTSRPGRVRHVLDVQLPGSRFDYHIRTSADFIRNKQAILDMVREETLKQYAEEAS
jgi:ABC-type nitrate/sulfonate/bicarbonate transport system ATPase subunit